MSTVDFTDLGKLTPQLPAQTPLTAGGKQPFDWSLFSILAGGLGQSIAAPYKDPFAQSIANIGGTAARFGQSRKMSKIAEKQNAERRESQNLLREIFGRPMTPTGQPGMTTASVAGSKGGGGLPELKFSLTPTQEEYNDLFGELGGGLTLGNVSPTQGQPEQVGGGSMLNVGMPTAGGMTHEQLMKANQPSAPGGLADISPLSLSPTGVNASDLVGLTPEQILSVSNQQADIDKMKATTFIDAMKLLGMPFKPEKPTEQFETLYDGRGRIFTQNLTTGELKQVSGVPTEAPLTLEQRKELKRVPETIPRGDYWKNPDSGDVKWIDSGTNPPAGYTQRVPSREREVSDLGERQFTFTKERSATTAAQNIRLNSKKEVIKPDIEFFNRNSNDAATTGFVWLTEKKGKLGLDFLATDINEAVEVVLPKDKDGVQVTMADVRAEAASRKISPEEVLKEIYDWKKKQEK